MKRLRSLQISTHPLETRCRCLTPSDLAQKKSFSGIAPHEVVREKVKSCYAKCVEVCSTDRTRRDAPGVEVIRYWERQTAHFQHPDILCCSLLNLSHVHGPLQKLEFLGRCKNGTSTFFGTRSSKGSETPYVRNSDSVLCLQMFGYALMDSPQRDRRECQVPRSTVTWRFFQKNTPWCHPPRPFIIQTP